MHGDVHEPFGLTRLVSLSPRSLSSIVWSTVLSGSSSSQIEAVMSRSAMADLVLVEQRAAHGSRSARQR